DAALPTAGQRLNGCLRGKAQACDRERDKLLLPPLVDLAGGLEPFGHDDRNGTRVVERHVLREAADAQPGLMPDAPGLRGKLAADDPKEHRLARAVAADDADALARLDLQ